MGRGLVPGRNSSLSPGTRSGESVAVLEQDLRWRTGWRTERQVLLEEPGPGDRGPIQGQRLRHALRSVANGKPQRVRSGEVGLWKVDFKAHALGVTLLGGP